MRVAMVSGHASPLAVPGGTDAGGQNVHVAALAAELVQVGHQVRVFTRADSPALPSRIRVPEGYVVEHLTAGPPRPLSKDDLEDFIPAFARNLTRRLAEEPVDIIHSHFWISGLASGLAAGELDIPWAHTFHALGVVKRRHLGFEDTSPVGRIGHERVLCRSVDRVVATCMDEVFELRAMGLNADRFSVIPGGVDLERFTPTGPRAEPGGFNHRILLISRLIPRKGIADAVEALSSLPGVELCIAGGPPAARIMTDPEARRLHALAQENGVANRVKFLGQVLHHQLPALIRSADVVVNVPWFETFGSVPLEAMACGKPVVATAVGGLTDAVVDGVTGILVPPRDAPTLARALCGLLGDDQRQHQYGQAGLQRVRQRYGWSRIARLTEGAYVQTMAQRTIALPSDQDQFA
jgi:glycosyltransferase involved in cell wall biosynthesis